MDDIVNIGQKIKKEPLFQQLLKEINVANQEAQKARSETLLKHTVLVKGYEKTENRKLMVYTAKIGNQNAGINLDDIALIGSMLASSGPIENLDLMLHSPGGSGVTAEKIVEMCREYTKKEFRVIVPNMAKSAATMIALGADEIVMGYCSELGPIDPQKFIKVSGTHQQISARSFISARENLLKELETAKKEGRETIGYLRQLSLMEPAFIEECKRELGFSIDLVKKWLPKYMLKTKNPGWSRARREKKAEIIAKNLSSGDEETDRFVHARMIGPDEAGQLGLAIAQIKKEDPVWKLLWEIYLRSEVLLMDTNNQQVPASKLFFDNKNLLLAS